MCDTRLRYAKNEFLSIFLIRTRVKPPQNQRMAMILENVTRFTPQIPTQITIDAKLLRKKLGVTPL